MTHPEGKYAWTVKVGEKGQFVIPKEARDIFGIKPGDTLIVLGVWREESQFLPKRLSHNWRNLFSPMPKKISDFICSFRCQENK